MEPHRRHAGGENDGVFLRDAHVVITVGHRLFQMFHAGAAGHGGGDADERVVLLAKFHQRLAHHVLIHRRRAGFGGQGIARLHVVGAGAVEFFRSLERGVKPLALLRENMNDDGMVAGLGKFQRADEQRQIVSVNRAEITHAHFLENNRAAVTAAAVRIRARRCFGCSPTSVDRALEPALGPVRQLERQFALGQAAHEIFKIPRQLVVARIGDELVQVVGNRADVFGDAPFVVVEDADEPFRRVADVVERLEGNAVGQRRVAENADDVFVRAAFVARRRHAERGGQRRARVAGAVAIVLAFRAQRETVQAVRLANRPKTVFAAGEHFVDVTPDGSRPRRICPWAC